MNRFFRIKNDRHRSRTPRAAQEDNHQNPNKRPSILERLLKAATSVIDSEVAFVPVRIDTRRKRS